MPEDKSATRDPTAALIYKFERRVEPPEDVRADHARWQDMREYVHTTAMLLDEEDAVGTNFVLRNQYALMSVLFPRNPTPQFVPRRWMPPTDPGVPVSYPDDIIKYGQTHSIVAERQQDKAQLKFILSGMAQDAMTLPIAWVKMKYQEDYTKDPLGYGRHNDQLDLVAKYLRLLRDYEERLFDEQDPSYEELQSLNRQIRAYVLRDLKARVMEELQEAGRAAPDVSDAELSQTAEAVQQYEENPEMLFAESDLPEVAYYRGYVFQQVDPEDIRYDWNITRPEDFMFAKWMAHRSFMTASDIKDKWGVEDEFLQEARRYDSIKLQELSASTGYDDPEYGGKDMDERRRRTESAGAHGDEERRGYKYAVWEYHDRVAGKIYRWIAGTGRFLDEQTPGVTWSGFFPFFPLIFNRVTGKTLGPSHTDFQQPLQDEMNMMRTHEREARRSNYPRYLVGQGLMSPKEKRQLAEALPYDVVEVRRPTDIKNSMHELISGNYDPRVYDRSAAMMEMQQMAGLPLAALGAGVVGNTATSDAITNEQMGNQVGDMRNKVEEVFRQISQAMAEINAQVLTEAEVKELAGPGAVWLEFDRQQILSQFILEIESEIDDDARRQATLSAWVQVGQISQQFLDANGRPLPWNPVAIMNELVRTMGIRRNLSEFIDVAGLMAPAAPADGGAAGGTPADPGANPDAQGAAGSQGGSPGIQSVPSPEQVPNSPA